MFVYGDVVMLKIGRYWPWKTVTVSSHLHMPVRPTLLHRMALVSFLLFRKNLGNLREFFGQMVYRPPGKKIARTPMQATVENIRDFVWEIYYWDLRTVNNAKSYIFLNEMNKKDLLAMYSNAFWCLIVVYCFFWLYCVTTVTPFIVLRKE